MQGRDQACYNATHRQRSPAMPLEVRTLSPALGAEILGVDLRNEVTADTLEAIMDAWHQHLVILFRNQVLAEDDQIRFERHFGVLQRRGRPAEARNEASRLK